MYTFTTSGTIYFKGTYLTINNTFAQGNTAAYGGFTYVERGEIESQFVLVENSNFFGNLATYGGVFGFSDNVNNITALFVNNTFINNGGESIIFLRLY